MGSALGVAMADSGHPVVALLGDGAFQFGLPALWTARRYQLPVTFVVLNNRTYSAVASALNRFGGAAVAGTAGRVPTSPASTSPRPDGPSACLPIRSSAVTRSPGR